MLDIIIFNNERAFIFKKSKIENRKNCVNFLFIYLLFNLSVISLKNLKNLKILKRIFGNNKR
jgi:hypothetical protein